MTGEDIITEQDAVRHQQLITQDCLFPSDQEVWGPIAGFESCYEVSSFGRIRSKARFKSNGKGLMKVPERIMKPFPNDSGYLLVDLHKEGKRKTMQVHRLVALAFIPNTDNKPQIDHINTVRTDNRVSNLKWCTVLENRHNPISEVNRIGCNFGYRHDETVKRKIRESQPNKKKIVQIGLDGSVIKEWDGIKEAARVMKLPQGNITKCCLGHRKTAGGYIWKYKK